MNTKDYLNKKAQLVRLDKQINKINLFCHCKIQMWYKSFFKLSYAFEDLNVFSGIILQIKYSADVSIK